MDEYPRLATFHKYMKDRRKKPASNNTVTPKHNSLFGCCNWTRKSSMYTSDNDINKRKIKRLQTLINDSPIKFGSKLPVFSVILKDMRDLRGIEKVLAEKIKITQSHVSIIPDEIAALSNVLKNLTLHQNQIKHIDNITKCAALINLNVSYNKITTVPRSFVNLKLLRELNLSNNSICELPDITMNVSQLHIRDNKLTDISILASWKELTILDISNNNIKQLPNFNSLMILKACNNNISGSVDLFTNNQQNEYITTVDLSHNKIKYFYCSTPIFNLYLNNNELCAIPSLSIDNILLNILQLNHNYIKNINNNSVLLPCNYEHIYLCHNSLRDTVYFNICRYLKTLALSDNFITDIVTIDEDCRCCSPLKNRRVNIQALFIDNNLLNDIDLYSYQKLKILSIKYNRLKSIPSIYDQLINLDISNNMIKEHNYTVPHHINMLNIRGNKIHTLTIPDTAHGTILTDKSTNILRNNDYATVTQS